MSRFAAQLLTHHRTDTIRPLFESLKAQTLDGWTLYWLDSGSTATEYAAMELIVAEVAPGFQIVKMRSETNINFSAGHQSLYGSHDAAYVALVNDDAIIDPGYFATLVAALDAHPEYAAVSGTILRWDFDASGRVMKSGLVDTLGLARSPWHAVGDIGAGLPFPAAAYPADSITPVFGVSGCLPVYRRAHVGPRLFDPSYVYYKEDVDVAYRLLKAGHPAGTVGGALAWHRRSLKPGFRRPGATYRSLFYSYRNHLWNLSRHLSWRDWLMYGWAVLPYELLKAAFLLVTHPTIIWRVIAKRPA